jgi:hypothetical protein
MPVLQTDTPLGGKYGVTSSPPQLSSLIFVPVVLDVKLIPSELISLVILFFQPRHSALFFMRSSSVPAATIGRGVAAAIGTFQALLSSPGGKGDYLVPEWSFWLAPCLVLIAAGLVARSVVPDAHAEPRPARKAFWAVVIWTVSCGLMAALAWAWLGFSGYFIRQTNEGPMRSARTGFLFGGGGTLLCLVAGELLLRWETGSFVKPRSQGLTKRSSGGGP